MASVRDASRSVAGEFPHVDGVEHRFVEANGLHFHAAEAGDASADPVVLLHGWPQHWYEWRYLIPPLAERYRVICPDLRGLGWSDAPPSGYEKETLADDILALLDELGHERVRLVGHDWGGWVGFLICLREPERVSRYLALNIAAPFAPVNIHTTLSMWRFWYQWVIASPLGARIVSGIGGPISRRALDWVGADCWTPEEREIFLGQFRQPERARASVLYYRTFQRELLALAAGRYRHAHLKTPTLVLFGTGDKVITQHHLDGIEWKSDDVTVELVHDSGHFIAEEKPDLVASRALEFFA
jgi:pimeloyl-ACP methyl ester carboxylesterase